MGPITGDTGIAFWSNSRVYSFLLYFLIFNSSKLLWVFSGVNKYDSCDYLEFEN